MKEHVKKILNTKWDVPFFEKLSETISQFSVTERAFFYLFCAVFLVSGVLLLGRVSGSYTVLVPTQGGELKEGIIGSPRFINPVLAVSDVDHDLSELVYSGLVKATPENTIVPDLSEDYTVSSDGLQYTFTLRDNAYFQDGTKVTADDVLFTIGKIQDSTIKSPLRPEFYDVTVEKIDDRTVRFTLKKPYAPFLQNLTVGILPKHLWDGLSSDEFSLSQYNVEPVGSGPYKISSMQSTQKNMLLIPTYYELEPFDKYTLGEPYIGKLLVRFYRDEKSLIDAYNKGDIESMNSISPDKIDSVHLQSGADVKTSTLPREFIVFFNQNQSPVLANKEVRQALNMSVDRQRIVQEVLNGYGTPIYGPVPNNLIGESSNEPDIFNIDAAKAVLSKAGWVWNASSSVWQKNVSKKQTIELDITLSTLNSPDLEKTAEIIKEDWESLGAKVEINEFDFGSLEQNILRPRKFEALLYGLVIGRDMDFFAFWHSSQRNDPGLNISMYANSSVDTILEDARKTLDANARIQKYLSFQDEIQKDIPAIFVYSPEFIYVTPGKIKGFNMGTVTLPYERFLDIYKWYIETNNLWTIFSK